MNWKWAVIAAGSGCAGVVTICVGLYATLLIAFYNWSPLGGGDPSVDIGQLLLFPTIPPALFSVGGALPARALGVGWRRSLLIALVAHVIGAFVLGGLLSEEPFGDQGTYAAAAFIPAAALTVLLAALYSSTPVGPKGSVAVIAGATTMVSLAMLFGHTAVGITVGILAWTLLPAIAASTRPQPDGEATP